jgi:hypothetical protein
VTPREYVVGIRDTETGARVEVRVEAPTRDKARERAVHEWRGAAQRSSGYRVESITPASQVQI